MRHLLGFLILCSVACATSPLPPVVSAGPPPVTETQGPRGITMPRPAAASAGVSTMLAAGVLSAAEANTREVMATAHLAPSDRQPPVLKARSFALDAPMAATVTPPIFLETAEPVDPTVPAICSTVPLLPTVVTWPQVSGTGLIVSSYRLSPQPAAGQAVPHQHFGTVNGVTQFFVEDARGCVAWIAKP